VAEAAKLAKFAFDLVVFDEAHRTVGARDREFATLLHDDAIKARRRMFMTATERKIGGDVDMSFSMDDKEEDYGERFFTMTFKEAISLGIITDYKIVTYSVTESEVNNLVKHNRLLNLGHNLEEAQAQDIAAGITAKRAMELYGVGHALVFNRSIRAAKDFREVQDVLNYLGIGPYAANFHVNGEMSAGVRKQRLDEFKQTTTSPATMTNARCLTEGVDVPGIDCVMFAAPKQSVIDIVQASGRAMRKAKEKKYGYLVIPIIVPDGKPFDEFAETTTFRKVVGIISALSTQDTRIVEELRAIFVGPTPKRCKPRERILKFGGEMPVGFKMSLEKFADAITARVWEVVARVNWRPFEEARAFARSLKLKSYKEWLAYCQSGKKPNDIPIAPHAVYADAGWIGLADWLGGRIRQQGRWRSFEEARAFARSLKLKGQKEWSTYCQSGKKPNDIPTAADRIYAGAGWINWADWLGGRIRQQGRWRSFEEARTFAHSLKLKSKTEWDDYSKSVERPSGIPFNPDKVYGNAFLSWGDWLGTGQHRKGDWRPFEEARAYVRDLNLKTVGEWEAYKRSGKRPHDIPAVPREVYADAGWVSMPDWLGNGRWMGPWRPFEEARAFVHALKLKNQLEWAAYNKTRTRPKDIPSDPREVYNDVWVGMNDWLGNGRRTGLWRPFEEARDFVRKRKFKSSAEWFAYAKSGKKPTDIPCAAYKVYADTGWVSFNDWLGISGIKRKNWRPFEEARAHVRKLKLQNSAVWRTYCKSGEKPNDIPRAPDAVYADAWVNWADWFGHSRRMTAVSRDGC
jgi:hypothetical protein